MCSNQQRTVKFKIKSWKIYPSLHSCSAAFLFSNRKMSVHINPLWMDTKKKLTPIIAYYVFASQWKVGKDLLLGHDRQHLTTQLDVQNGAP